MPLVSGRRFHRSSNRPFWAPPTPLPWHSEAWWSSRDFSSEVPWSFSCRPAEGLQPRRGAPLQAVPHSRAGSPRTSPEVRGATKPGPGPPLSLHFVLFMYPFLSLTPLLVSSPHLLIPGLEPLQWLCRTPPCGLPRVRSLDLGVVWERECRSK